MYIRKEVLTKRYEFYNTAIEKFKSDISFYNSIGIPYGVRSSMNKLLTKECRCGYCQDNPFDSDDDINVTTREKDGKTIATIKCSECSEDVVVITSDFLSRLLVCEPKDISNIDAEYDRRFNARSSSKKIIREEEKENDDMINTNKMFKGFDFGVVSGDSGVRVSHLGLAIKNSDGIFVAYDSNEGTLTDVDLFDIDLEGMIYKMPVAHKEVKPADVIVHNKTPMIVQNVLETGNIEVIDPVAGEVKTIMPTKSMFGFNFFTKIVSLIDMSGTNADENNPFGNLMPLMLMSGGKSDINPMMMAMMQGGNMKDMFSNPMMMMAMMGDNSSLKDMLPLMMMMGDNNPFSPKKEK